MWTCSEMIFGNQSKISDRISLAEVAAHIQGAIIQAKWCSTSLWNLVHFKWFAGSSILLLTRICLQEACRVMLNDSLGSTIQWCAYVYLNALLLHRASYTESPATFLKVPAVQSCSPHLCGSVKRIIMEGTAISIALCFSWLNFRHPMLKRRTSSVQLWKCSCNGYLLS